MMQVLRAFAEGWEAHRHRHCIWIVSPATHQHHRAFDEVADSLAAAFAELGGSAPVVRDPADWNGRAPLVLGGHLLSEWGPQQLPPDSIIFNLEQFDHQVQSIKSDYLFLLADYPFLDYSRRNIAAIRSSGLAHAQLLELGYSGALQRIPAAPEQDIDVLFYGWLNDRRMQVMDALDSAGVNLHYLFDVYGAERDAVIARSKIVLNMHAYDANIFEIVRVSYLLANGACVVSEGDPDDPDVQGLAGGPELVPYTLLAQRCVDLLQDERRRRETARRGAELIRARPQARLLMECIERSAASA